MQEGTGEEICLLFKYTEKAAELQVKYCGVAHLLVKASGIVFPILEV